MRRNFALLSLIAIALVPALGAQTVSYSPARLNSHGQRIPQGYGVPDFSRIAVGGGVSTMGINLQTAINVAQHFNVRGVGNFFNYTASNISSSGFTASGTINLATAGASLDYYPWANHGFRISPGALFYNQSAINATMVAQGGTSFTLDGYTYYSSQTNPVTGTAGVTLNKEKIAPTVSLGWGNMIPRKGGHWSFPFEVGAAYIGEPQLALALVSGQVCSDPAGTLNCQPVAGNSQLTSNLQAQQAKDQKDLQPLRFYPQVSFGVAYSFRFRVVE
jgi:hypothetical protein